MDSVRWFRTRAKKLLKAYRANDDGACRYFGELLPNCEVVKLQNVQHALAVEAGFRNWADLLQTPEDDRRAVISTSGEKSSDLNKEEVKK